MARQRLTGVALMLLLALPVAGGGLEPAKTWNRERAAHLLRRLGFGGTPAQVDFLHGLGLAKAVDYLIDYERVTPNDADFIPVQGPDLPVMRAMAEDFSAEDRQEAREKLNQLRRRSIAELQAWWMRRMIVTSRPFEEKMTFFWHGHFTSGAREVKSSNWMWQQNQFLRANATGKFRDLLIGISQDPAMLAYLDNISNRKQHPNENYARELMELFTMGEGTYTEKDVTEAARAFTGWRADRQGYRFARRQHDFGDKTFLGRSGNFNGDDVIEIILEQPAASQHMARKLLTFFVQPDPPSETVQQLAAVLRGNGFDFGESMRTLARSEAFFAPEAMHSQIKSPVELIVGTVRMLETEPADVYGMVFGAAMMGQTLFQPPNVKGWDGGRTWITTATLFNRYNTTNWLVNGGQDEAFKQRLRRYQQNFDAIDELMDNIEDYPGLVIPDTQVPLVMQPPYDVMRVVKAAGLKSADEITDHFVARLLQRPIDAEQRALLRKLMDEGQRAFDVNGRDAVERIQRLIGAIMTMPEFQLQ